MNYNYPLKNHLPQRKKIKILTGDNGLKPRFNKINKTHGLVKYILIKNAVNKNKLKIIKTIIC